jgi:hypothetical protein
MNPFDFINEELLMAQGEVWRVLRRNGAFNDGVRRENVASVMVHQHWFVREAKMKSPATEMAKKSALDCWVMGWVMGYDLRSATNNMFVEGTSLVKEFADRLDEANKAYDSFLEQKEKNGSASTDSES